MNTAKAAVAMRMVVYGMQKLQVKNPDYVALGRLIMEKMDALPSNASAKDIAIAVLENK